MSTSAFDLSNRLFRLLSVATAGLLFFLLLTVWNSAKESEAMNQINVEGNATLSIEPDLAYVYLGVRTEDVSSSDVIDRNMNNMTAVIEAIKALGIEEKDIQTQDFSVSPKYEYRGEEYVEVGYEAYQTVTVTLKDFALIGDLISNTGKAGANQFNGVRFEREDYEAQLAEVRQQALDEARAKAISVAQASGQRLGDLVSYSEYTSSGSYGEGKGGAMFNAMSSSYASSIQAGQEEVVLTVNVSYRIR